MSYTIKEAAEQANVSEYRIRYYDGLNLIPDIGRDRNNHRIFSDQSVDIIRLINCFRLTNMPLKDIRRYIDLLADGEASRPERLAIMSEHQAGIEAKAAVLAENLGIVTQKIADLTETTRQEA